MRRAPGREPSSSQQAIASRREKAVDVAAARERRGRGVKSPWRISAKGGWQASSLVAEKPWPCSSGGERYRGLVSWSGVAVWSRLIRLHGCGRDCCA